MSIIHRIETLQNIIGTDAGGRGMKSLIVPGDLMEACRVLGSISSNVAGDSDDNGIIIVLSGFPCCVNESPPTETDGPPGACAIARAALALGEASHHKVVLVTDDCNATVFMTAASDLLQSFPTRFSIQSFPPVFIDVDEARLHALAQHCRLLIACERAGPAKNGVCYTMRGIDMTAAGLIAPLHRLVLETKARHHHNVPFIAIGDGGNELGMGKVIDKIISNPEIPDGDKIGCIVPSDYLIASSVSNWGGYALAAGAALVRAEHEAMAGTPGTTPSELVQAWLGKCLPSEQHEIDLLNRCVAAGCRDGVSGKAEPTVDGMPLERSLACLRDLRAAALGQE